MFFFSVFSEEEPDLNSELEVSVSDLIKLRCGLLISSNSADHRDSGGDRGPADGEAEDSTHAGHDGVRLSGLHVLGQQLLRAHDLAAEARTGPVLGKQGKSSYASPPAPPRE